MLISMLEVALRCDNCYTFRSAAWILTDYQDMTCTAMACSITLCRGGVNRGFLRDPCRVLSYPAEGTQRSLRKAC